MLRALLVKFEMNNSRTRQKTEQDQWMYVLSKTCNFRRMKQFILLFSLFFHVWVSAQVDNTMYGLYQIANPPSFQFASIDPLSGQVNPIGSTVLSTMVNATGSALNPYSQTYSYQDEDSWLSLDLQTGAIVNDVMVSLPNATGNFDNFRFNAADSNMYGLYSQVISDPVTGFVNLDLKLATCDLTTGLVDLISPNSIAQSYTMSGSTIDPYLMVYYFESEGKFMGIDLYNGEIYSQPTISVDVAGSFFSNFAYSCADTAVYGLIMNNGVKALGKINPQTGVVTTLPTVLSFDNFVMNSGGAIDPINLVYYFQTIDTAGQNKLVGLSLMDGSVASQSVISTVGNYFTMYRIQSDCYLAEPSRLNPLAAVPEMKDIFVHIYPNPAEDFINVKSEFPMNHLEILNADGTLVKRILTNEMDVQVSVESLSDGLYYLRVCSNEASYTERFIKD